MEPEGSLPYSQVPTTSPYPEPTPSSPHDPLQLPEVPSYLLTSHLRLGLSNCLFPSGFLTNTLYTPLSSPIRTTCPTHHILLNLTTRTILGKEYRSFSSSLCNFHRSHVTPSLLGLNTALNTQFSNNLRVRFSHNVSDQVSHQYKTTGKIIISIFLDI
jgi:hypothetical protein